MVASERSYHLRQSRSSKSTSHRTKHIAVRYFFIKEKIDDGEIEMEYTPTLQMLVEMFIKPQQGELFRVMRAKVLECCVIYFIKDVELLGAKTIRVCALHNECLRV